MADDRHLVLARILLLTGITVLVGGALEEFDEALYLFLFSQLPPPPACPDLEVYQTCSGNCSDCARRGACPADCSFHGCDCLHNFARLEPGGPCQHVHLCPVPACGANEVFRACGAVCEQCGGMRCRMLQCEHRCYCAEGNLRDAAGRCVPEEQCPPLTRCFRDEEMGTKGRADEYCLRDEATSNVTETRDRCYCREGFSRDAMGHCVRDELCEKVSCPGVEVYQSCPRKCRVSCRGDPVPCEEDGQCFPGCFCPEGHLVDDFRRCVPEHQCPTDSSTPAPSTDSSTPLDMEVQVSSSIPSSAKDEEEILELTEQKFVDVGSTTDTALPITAEETTTSSAQGGKETSQSPATEQGEKSTTTTAAPQITGQETTRADDEATTSEEREDEVVPTTTPTTSSEEEENDF